VSSERIIRPLALADSAELADLYALNRDFLAPFDPFRPGAFFRERGQRDRIERMLADRAADRGYGYAILDGDAVAGTISLSNVVRGPLQSANVGYWVDRDRNGRGLASTALAAVVDVAFGDLSLHRLEAGTLLDNLPSQRVLAKNGFERIGVARDYLLIAGRWRDHVLFQRVVGV
jgi:ribosomal-protein-alanine N-acetyltransferase